MGGFEGHVIPSIAYAVLSFWWAFVNNIRYIRSLKNTKNTFTGSTWMPCFFLSSKKWRNFPFESFLKVFLLLFHVCFEIYNGLRHVKPDGTPIRFGNENAHHICMISGFIVGAIIEILIYYSVPFPKKTEYFFNLLAFLIQALIMTEHLDGDEGIEHHVHKLWTIVIIFSFVTACLEVHNPNNFWIIYLRIYFFLVQASWMMQIAFVVWPKTDNPFWHWGMDMTSHTWLSISLMYHLIGCAILMMLQYLFVFYSINFFDKFYTRYEFDNEKDMVHAINLTNLTNNDEYKFLINDEED